MKQRKQKSLKRRLIAQLLLFQIGILFLLASGFVGYLLAIGESNFIIDPDFTEVIARSVDRNSDGALVLNETDEINALRDSIPNFWFVARAQDGQMVHYGTVPQSYMPMTQSLEHIRFADIRDTVAPFHYLASIREVSGPAGGLVIMGKGALFSTAYIVLMLSNLVMLPILVILSLIIVSVIPWIVSRAFKSLSNIATEAGSIDIDRRGYRLPETGIPGEVQPLVIAINGALQRLDEGYERQQRFILDAAHELRTPVAILQTRVETLVQEPIRHRLLSASGRIAALAEQLLDLQRLDLNGTRFSPVELVALSREVAADMAPLAIAQGYEIAFDTDIEQLIVEGDRGALQRAILNLVQNAIEHGGSKGTISIFINKQRIIEVCDEGLGVPPDERERIFDAFHRLQPRDHGAGLGLNLVREIMKRHGGHVSVMDAPHGGACFSLVFLKSE